MQEIVRHALDARRFAYAPYSGYAVGACLLGGNGRLYTGCNIENASYGLTLCAERVAVAHMVADGCQEILEVAVATVDAAAPCGMCLQTLAEFAIELNHVLVHCSDLNGLARSMALHELLPHAFCSEKVRQNRRRPGESE
jgi:cytidine deaminase